ncbi:MAG: signal peptidase I [Candidatus Omnitrophota bacterium]
MPKLSKLALLSLVSGVLSFLVFILSPIAIVSGLAALYMIVRSKASLKGKALAVCGISAGFAAIAFTCFMMLGYGTHYKSFRVPTASMSPTIKAKERMIVDLKAYREKDPARGDIVTYELLSNGKRRLMCKRIVGLPGEEVEIRSGRIFINGVMTEVSGLPASVVYVNAGKFGKAGECIKVPDYFYYMLGDDPPQSYDSRQHGPVDRRDINGKYVFAYRWFDSKIR